MTLEKAQEDAVRKQVIEQFGEECVKRMDNYYMELNDLRMSSVSSYDFLEKVKLKYLNPDTDLVLAGLLFGMKMGEIGYEYHLKQMEDERLKVMEVKKELENVDLEKKASEYEAELKKKKLEADWEAADAIRAREAAELFYQ